jgi:hypothetical protein
VLRDFFWEAYPRATPQTLTRLLRLARAGEPREPFAPPQGRDGLKAEQEQQLAELERSVRFCRKVFADLE